MAEDQGNVQRANVEGFAVIVRHGRESETVKELMRSGVGVQPDQPFIYGIEHLCGSYDCCVEVGKKFGDDYQVFDLSNGPELTEKELRAWIMEKVADGAMVAGGVNQLLYLLSNAIMMKALESQMLDMLSQEQDDDDDPMGN
jgi:hypothetical protein